MDTLRADHLGAYGYGRNTSPTIDTLAEKGTLYAKASSTSAWTSPAHASLFTGRYPHEVGLTLYRGRKHADRLKNTEMTIAEVFRDHGYQTVAFSGGGFVAKALGFGQGFLEHVEGKRLEHYAERAASWLRSNERSKPFFMFLHFYNCHRAYRPPGDYATMFRGDYQGKFPIRKYCGRRPTSQEDWDYVVSQYDGEIAYADHLLGGIVEAAGKDTLIVFLSDHGEEFNDHGGCDHTGTLYEELVHIPLIFSGPRIPKGARVDIPVSLIDVPRTLFTYADIPPPESFGGESLLPWEPEKEEERPQYYETGTALNNPVDIVGARRGPWKVIKDRVGPEQSLFHLARDPTESDNLHERGETNEHVEALVTKWVRPLGQNTTNAPVDESTQQELEALGYVE